MSFQDAVKSALSQYAGFSGRARRSEYWFFALFFVAVLVAALIVDAVIGTEPLFYLVALAGLFLPNLAVSVRRLHDTDRSGWWVLLGLVPFGFLVLLFFYVQDSKPGDNSHGPSPKGEAGLTQPDFGI